MDARDYAPIRSFSFMPFAGVILIAAALMASAWPWPRAHALLIDLPFPSINPVSAPDAIYRIGVTRNGMVTLDGQDTSIAGLRDRLQHLDTANGHFVIVFEPAGDAAYGTSARVLKALWDMGLTADRFCFGGLEQHRFFETRPAQRLNLTLADPPSSDTTGFDYEPVYFDRCDPNLIDPPKP